MFYVIVMRYSHTKVHASKLLFINNAGGLSISNSNKSVFCATFRQSLSEMTFALSVICGIQPSQYTIAKKSEAQLLRTGAPFNKLI